MIHDLKPYPAMKDSGVPWLGQVPEHWDVQPALAVYKPRAIKNVGMVEKTVLSLSYGRIVVKPEEKLRGLVPESFETYQIVEPGNIIVRTTDLQNDKNSLRIGHSKNRGIITSAYMCLETTDRVLNKFGYQYLNAYDLLKIIYGYGSGLRQNLDFKDIRRMPVLVPKPDEQAAIVRFLDHADRRIRKAIAAKQKLIKLLQEQKQVIIHQAVTRGLDPNVKLKPSGVEWLGDVPEGWEVIKLGRIAQLTTGFPFKSEGFSTSDQDIPLLRGINVNPGSLKWGEVVRWPAVERQKYANFELAENDLVLGMDRPIVKEGVRVAAIKAADLPALLLQRVARLRPLAALDWRFALLLLQSNGFSNYLAPIFTGISVPHLSPEQIKAFIVALPPVHEQRVIISHIDAVAQVNEQASERFESEIAFLREYRTRLIADVVTGKLDVRDAAAQLPELTDEVMPAELDDVEDAEADDLDTDGAED